MATKQKVGRPQRAYETTQGEVIPGLYHCPDGRWRITATGAKFTEPDERRAVAKFWSMTKPADVQVPVGLTFSQSDGPNHSEVFIKAEHPPETYWPWLREQLIADPAYIARQVGIPELANLAHLPMPKATIVLEDLITIYEDQNPSTALAKREAVAVFRRLAKHAGATTLNHLTQDALLAFRKSIESDARLTSAGTRASYYARVKTVISFGLKVGLDQAQIRGALDRCKVLWTGEPTAVIDPTPISPAHFHALLAGAGQTSWRAWLLLALNLCLYPEDLCHLRWDDLDLANKTYAAIRKKTRRDKVPRAAVLWDETIAALNMVRRSATSPYVFTSPHGTRYDKHGRVNEFARLRERWGVPDTVKFRDIRDGCYTAAVRGSHDEKWARVLAGHRAPGLQDSYVLRNPEATRPACEAVYKAYGPFPLPNV